MNSTNISILMESLRLYSLKIVTLQAPINIFALVIITLAILMSGSQLALICAWKPLRGMHQVLIATVAISDLTKGLSMAPQGARHLYAYYTGFGEVNTRLNCLFWLYPMYLSHFYAYTSFLALSVDRLAAISVPIWYRTNHRKFKIWLVLSSVLAAIFVCIFLVVPIDDKNEILYVCTTLNGPSESFQNLIALLMNGFSGAILLTNGLVICVLIKRWRAAKKNADQMRTFRNNVQANVLKTQFAVLALFILSMLVGSLTVSVMRWMDWSDVDRTAYSAISGIFQLFRSIFDCPVYVWLSKEYRKAFLVVVLRKNVAFVEELQTRRSVNF